MRQFYFAECRYGTFIVSPFCSWCIGLKRLESGAFVKDYEDASKEVEQAVQMSVPEVVFEDPRFMEKPPPPLSEEFPEGSRIFFLGEHAYGVAAQVSGTTEDTLSVVLAVCDFLLFAHCAHNIMPATLLVLSLRQS